MKDSINKKLPTHKIIESAAENIYIVDYKQINGGGVELLETEPDVKYVWLKNDSALPIYFDAFSDNALPVTIGEYSSQCEGVAFPTTCQEQDWVLFIECKYAYSLKQATDKSLGYPKRMITQIIATVEYFREKGILSKTKRADAIVAFPNLMEAFDSWFFPSEYSVDIILRDHKIRIRPTNSATILTSKRIKLGATL